MFWEATERHSKMGDLKGALIFGQSGGPTAVINASLAGVAVAVRFNVPRERISDNTAHAILRIIRELATNAVRHGKANRIDITGAIRNGRLDLRVRDNGFGFDPDSRPGVGEGHFGLQGVAERVRRLDGEMRIDSRVGSGTDITLLNLRIS